MSLLINSGGRAQSARCPAELTLFSSAYSHITDKLDEARAELCRLQGTERTLIKQLVEIRAAVKAQKCKIDELVEKRPPAINRLPIELLSRIMFQSLPTYDDHRVFREYLELANYRTNLSMVSRLWRNVVLGTPKLWSEIVLTGDQPLAIASLETQLRRSCEVPLNIIIMNWFYDDSEGIQPWLDVLFSSTNRWQCLHIFDVDYGLANIFYTIEAKDLEFPSLKDVHIDIHGEFTYLRFLLPNRAPALRNLELLNFVPTPEFTTATTLSTLHLTFINYLNQTIITPIPLIIPAQSLTILSLTGCTTGWVLLPDCIHLPLLEVLILAINNPQQFMQVIVAPKLICFECSSYDFQRKLTNFGTGSKFNHVQTFTLNATGVDAEGGDALCQEFCGVRHVNLHATAILALCTREAQLGDSDSVPVDHLTSLETLTIRGLSFSYPQQFDFLVRWLTKRVELGQPRLSVRLSGVSSLPMDGAELVGLCNKLRSCSILEVDDMDLRSSAHCSTGNGLLQLDLRGTDTFIADDIFLASFRGSVP